MELPSENRGSEGRCEASVASRRLSSSVRTGSIGGAVAAFGLLVLATGGGEGRVLGVAAVAGGLTAIGWQLRREYSAHIARRRALEELARRTALRDRRRIRHHQLRETRRQARRQAVEAALAAARERDRLTEQEARLRAAREAQQAATHAAIASEAERLRSLSDEALCRQALLAFSALGYAAEPVPDAPGDIQLTADGGAAAVARCLPADRVGRPLDVEAVESWRVQNEAERAYLVGLAGFTPRAVERVRTIPVTLVDPFLLATWRLTPRSEQ